ncbi:MAG: CsgG/HfaB family protein [Reyranellaceae bacterium]
MRKFAAIALAGSLLAGCADITLKQMAPDEAPVVVGPAARLNRTPLENAFVCYGNTLKDRRAPRLAIAVGDVKDYTGKYNESEGSAITQGGALMVYSALGKLGDSVLVQERFDTRIAELELAYIDRRQLGDGRQHQLGRNQPAVPWVPYFGGSILRSNYYIVGGITELNYNIQSGGAEFQINNMGPKARVFTMNVGIDLRIIDTQSLVVKKTASLQKQITGFEVGFNTFRFFNTNLFDINIGNKSQEPIQLGVRIVLEQATLELLSAVTGVDDDECVARALANGSYQPEPTKAEAAPVAPPAAGTGTPVVHAAAQSENAGALGGAPTVQVPFEFNSTAIGGQATPAIGEIVAGASKGGAVNIQILGRDSETWAPQKREEIVGARIAAVNQALVARGINANRIRLVWKPAISDTGMRRDGAGYQIFAIMSIAASS